MVVTPNENAYLEDRYWVHWLYFSLLSHIALNTIFITWTNNFLLWKVTYIIYICITRHSLLAVWQICHLCVCLALLWCLVSRCHGVADLMQVLYLELTGAVATGSWVWEGEAIASTNAAVFLAGVSRHNTSMAVSGGIANETLSHLLTSNCKI